MLCRKIKCAQNHHAELIQCSHFAQLSPQVDTLNTFSGSNFTQIRVFTPPDKAVGGILPKTGLPMIVHFISKCNGGLQKQHLIQPKAYLKF